MRISFDVASLMNPRTGVGHYAATLLDRMMTIEPDNDFTLFALTWGGDPSRVPRGPRVEFRRSRIPARVMSAWELAGRPKGETLTGEADVVHGPNFWIPPISRTNGIVTIHDMTFWLYPELVPAFGKRLRRLVPRVLRRCAAVITPSRFIADQVASELHFPSERIFVTHEGVRGTFQGAEPDPKIESSLGVHRPYLLFAGTQEPRKNLDRLIQSLQLIDPALSLVIAGPPGWGSVDLKALAHKLHLDDRVVFAGYQSDAGVASLMAGATAFVYPSLYEGFGLPPLEAMIAGSPVVAGRAGALPEVLGDAPFYCDPEDVASIASAIEAAVTSESSETVARGRRQASKYDWNQTARQTLEAYRVAAG